MKVFNENKQKGAVIVEATLVLPIFIFLVITLMWIANLCTAQAKIQIAINSAAKEISTYSYLYGLTGLNEKRAALAQEGSEATGLLDDGIDGITGVYNGFSELSEKGKSVSSNPDEIVSLIDSSKKSASSIKEGAKSIQNVYETIKKDPKGFLIGLGKATANVGIDEATSYIIAAPLAKVFCEKHLSTSNLTADQYLKKLGVVGGYDGIDFTSSRFCTKGSDDIFVVAKYQLKVIQFFKIDISYNFVQSGRTKAWFGK